MPATALITPHMAALQRQNRGSVCLLHEGHPFEDIWSYIHTKKDWHVWDGLCIDAGRLQSCLDSLSTRLIEEHVEAAQGMDFFGRLHQSHVVENDRVFQWDVKYVLAFVRMLADRGDLGNPEALWDSWSLLNSQAMQANLRPLWFDYESCQSACRKPYRGEPSSAVAHVMEEQPREDLRAARREVLEGAEYRCKRNYAAFIRELYTLVSLTEEWDDPEEEIRYAPCRVFWHPAIDMACKCDALVIPPDSAKMGLVGLAIHLKSVASNRHAAHKQCDVPQVLTDNLHHMLSLAIPISAEALRSHKIILPSAHKLTLLRRALAGDRASMHMLGHYYCHRNRALFS